MFIVFFVFQIIKTGKKITKMQLDGSLSILVAALNGCVTLEKLTSQKHLLPDINQALIPIWLL